MLRRALLAAVLSCVAAAAWSAVQVSIGELIARPDAFHGKSVSVSGRTSGVKQKTSKAGRPYTVFALYGPRLGERVSVFAWGHPAVADGARVIVTGTYQKEKVVGPYTFTNEIEAEEIR